MSQAFPCEFVEKVEMSERERVEGRGTEGEGKKGNVI